MLVYQCKQCLPEAKEVLKQVAGKGKEGKEKRLLDRFLKSKPEFKPFKFEMAADLHERLEKLKKQTGLMNGINERGGQRRDELRRQELVDQARA